VQCEAGTPWLRPQSRGSGIPVPDAGRPARAATPVRLRNPLPLLDIASYAAAARYFPLWPPIRTCAVVDDIGILTADSEKLSADLQYPVDCFREVLEEAGRADVAACLPWHPGPRTPSGT
jgi:hypothetical protein